MISWRPIVILVLVLLPMPMGTEAQQSFAGALSSAIDQSTPSQCEITKGLTETIGSHARGSEIQLKFAPLLAQLETQRFTIDQKYKLSNKLTGTELLKARAPIVQMLQSYYCLYDVIIKNIVYLKTTDFEIEKIRLGVSLGIGFLNYYLSYLNEDKRKIEAFVHLKQAISDLQHLDHPVPDKVRAALDDTTQSIRSKPLPPLLRVRVATEVASPRQGTVPSVQYTKDARLTLYKHVGACATLCRERSKQALAQAVGLPFEQKAPADGSGGAAGSLDKEWVSEVFSPDTDQQTPDRGSYCLRVELLGYASTCKSIELDVCDQGCGLGPACRERTVPRLEESTPHGGPDATTTTRQSIIRCEDLAGTYKFSEEPATISVTMQPTRGFPPWKAALITVGSVVGAAALVGLGVYLYKAANPDLQTIYYDPLAR